MNYSLLSPSPHFGLVCVTASDAVRFRTLTRDRLLKLTLPQQEQKLLELYTENLRRLEVAIQFCERKQIRLYRMGSGLFPFSDEPVGEPILAHLTDEMQRIGAYARQAEIRLVLHPNQFVVLNSDRPEVIANSIKILTAHANMMDQLGQPRSPWALMNIHGGKGGRGERLIQVIKDLPDSIRLRLTLENDEYTYGVDELFEICQATGVPLVFDAHHHIIHEKLDSYEDPSVEAALLKARATWPNPDWQLVHISNGDRHFNDSNHSQFITAMPSCYRKVAWIEIEAKQKEKAIAQLQQDWV